MNLLENKCFQDEFFSALKNFIKCQSSSEFEKILRHMITNSMDPHKAAEEILVRIEETIQTKKTMPLLIDILQNDFPQAEVSQDVKRGILTMLFLFQGCFLNQIIETFKLNQPYLSLIHEFISKWVNEKITKV